MEEVSRLTTTERTLEFQNGTIVSTRHRSIHKQEARVFQDGKVSMAATIGQMDDQAVIELARKASSAIAYPYAYDLPSARHYGKSLQPESPRIEGLANLATELMVRLHDAAPDFLFSGKVTSVVTHRTFRTSAGSDLAIAFERTSWYALFKHKTSVTIFDGAIGAEGILEPPAVAEEIETILPYLRRYEHPVPLPAGRELPVLFVDPRDLLACFDESLRVDRYNEGTALFSSRPEGALFSDRFFLDDINFAPDKGVVAPFDGEGVLRNDSILPLISRGRICGTIADLQHGAKYGVPSTGNGLRSFGSGVSLDFNALAIRPGAVPYQALLSSLPQCVVVLVAMGGNTSDDGQFSTPVGLSYLVERGEIVGRLPQLTVTAPIREIFGERLIEISSDTFDGGGKGLNPCVAAEMQVIRN